jgi:hypothetical protein
LTSKQRPSADDAQAHASGVGFIQENSPRVVSRNFPEFPNAANRLNDVRQKTNPIKANENRAKTLALTWNRGFRAR